MTRHWRALPRGRWFRPCAVALVIFGAGTLAQAADDLILFEDDEIAVEIPRGWTISRQPSSGFLKIEWDPATPDSPQVLIRTDAPDPPIESDQLVERLSIQLGGRFQSITREPFAGSRGTLNVFDRTYPTPLRVGILQETEPEGTWGVTALLLARPEVFSDMEGIKLLMSIARSARPVDTTLYRDDNLVLQIPNGWSAVPVEDAVLLSPPSGPERIAVQNQPMSKAMRADPLAQLMAAHLGPGRRRLDRRAAPGGLGLIFVYVNDTIEPPVHLAILLDPHPDAQSAMVGTWEGPSTAYDGDETVRQLSRIVRSARVADPDRASGPPRELRVPLAFRPVHGAWTIAADDVDLTDETFAALFLEVTGAEPAATIITGGDFRFAFHAAGTYDLTVTIETGVGAETSRVTHHETGRFRIDGDHLMMLPRSLTMTMGEDDATPIAADVGRSRRYTFAAGADALVLHGPPAAFQTDATDTGDDVVLPMVRAAADP